jgi:Pyruvate/2-oxoacid:ferredoxin oxidoreductase delta subunit
VPKHEVVTADMLHLWYDAEARAAHEPTIDPQRRARTFDEVVHGLDAGAARYESQRCLSCGNCFECDGCFSACPEHAIIKLGPGLRYAVDQARCTGCAICFEQCPVAAITMVAEHAS